MATNAQLAQQAQDSMRAAKRLHAIVELATGIEWKTSSGETVRVARHGDGWGVYGSDVLWTTKSTASAAVDFAARTLPPADADLAALLTWTTCGRSRI
ncbi:hypothetical protein ABZ249_25420 [Nocardiopsis sp. NPDC006139]|uniref:hypothetical protein n=1 Tax=Nocardiopsis sp. NPDC006139 TaxID=3154578 RepID=UPI0033AADBAB